MSGNSATGSNRTIVVLGGTQGIGRELVAHLAAQGTTVYLSGRTMASAQKAVDEIGLGTRPLAVDLSEPTTIRDALAGVGPVDGLVICAIERDSNTIGDYDIAGAIRLVTGTTAPKAQLLTDLKIRNALARRGLALEMS